MAALTKGDRVRVLVDTPGGEPVDGTVFTVNSRSKDGKKVGVELDHYVANGHSLDGALDAPEKVDGASGQRFGKGWWTLEENVEVL